MPNTPIVRIYQGQPELAVRISHAGCGSTAIDVSKIRLIVRAPQSMYQQGGTIYKQLAGNGPFQEIL